MPSRKIHVAIIVKAMSIGGLERCISRIANSLNRDRFEVSIICLHKAGEAVKWIERDDVKIIPLGFPSGNNVRVVWSLAKTLRRINADIAHSHNWATLLETFLACKLTKGVRHLHAERGTLLNSPSKSVVKNWIRRQLFRFMISRVDKCMTNAHSLAEKIQGITAPRSIKISIIPNGLDCPYTAEELGGLRTQIRNQLGIKNEQCLIGSVGRLHAVKNFELAIRALGKVHDKQNDVRLIIVGDGPEKINLEQLIVELNLEHAIDLVGDQQDIWPYLAAMDIYINTSHSEGMSQSIVEAMACGKPVVATDVGDAFQLLTTDRQCGAIVPANQIDRFSDSLHHLVTNHELRQKTGENAAELHALKYSLEMMKNSFEEQYTSLCDDIHLIKADNR